MAAKEDTDMDKFRAKVLERGAHSIKGIGRTFRIYDDDGNRNLNFEEFCEGCKDYGIKFPQANAKNLFNQFDKDESGTMSFDEFLEGLRGNNFKGSRMEVVKKAFKKADKTGDGVFDVHDLKKVYNAKHHPKYMNGEMTETQVFTEFLKSFEPDPEKRDGKVTEEEFLNYYAGVSASVDNDAHFVLSVTNAWKI